MEKKTRTIASSWFEVKVKYLKHQENGAMKNVCETYAVEALTFTNAEVAITKEVAPYVHDGGFYVVAEKIAPYKEVLVDSASLCGEYYRVKVEMTITEESGDVLTEKKAKVCYLVQADGVEEARKEINALFEGSASDYEIVSVSKTAIVDVITAE